MPLNFIYAVFYGMVLAGIYALFYYLNHKTPVPKDCKDLKLDCDGCKISSCELHPDHDIKEDKNV